MVILHPEDWPRKVTLYIARTKDYNEMGVVFCRKSYFPWLGKWRSNEDESIAKSIDFATAGFYDFRLDLWPPNAPTRDEEEGWEELRSLTPEEKASVMEYIEAKKNLIKECGNNKDELNEKMKEITKKLEDGFAHLYKS